MEPGLFCAFERRLALSSRALWMILAVSFAAALAACSAPPRLNYDLSAATGGFSARVGRGQLVVLEPTAFAPLDSDRIVVRTNADALAYLSGAQWVDQLPALVQARLIATFENAHLLRAVGRLGMVADYSLQTTIRRFELDAARGEVLVELYAEIVGPNGRISAGRRFSASAPAPNDNAATVTRALDAALSEVMRQIVVWIAPKV